MWPAGVSNAGYTGQGHSKKIFVVARADAVRTRHHKKIPAPWEVGVVWLNAKI